MPSFLILYCDCGFKTICLLAVPPMIQLLLQLFCYLCYWCFSRLQVILAFSYARHLAAAKPSFLFFMFLELKN